MTGVQTCAIRSEEHTSELQSHDNLVCRLLFETTIETCVTPWGSTSTTWRAPHRRSAARASTVGRLHHPTLGVLSSVAVALVFPCFFFQPGPPQTPHLSPHAVLAE